MGMIFIHAEDRGDLYHNVVGIPSAYHHYHLLSHGKIDGQNWHILFSLYFKYRNVMYSPDYCNETIYFSKTTV